MSFKKKINVYKSPKSAMLWAIAFPGLGQLYNRDYIVGFSVFLSEFIINVLSQLNLAIYHSFIGEFEQSFQVINMQWLLFYPSIYAFSIWDAYNRAKEINLQLEKDNITPPTKTITKYTGLFFGFLIGILFGVFWFTKIGPIFGGLLFGFIGAIIGNIVEKVYVHFKGYRESEF